MSNIRTAKIIGYFSMPSVSMAEHNPTAYNLAMASMPAGAGSCSHCGNGILHHVFIRDADGNRRFIGTTCAEKVGLDRDAVRYRMTTEQMEARAAKRAEAKSKDARMTADWENHLNEWQARRSPLVAELVVMLRALNSDFHASLAEQLEDGTLSYRQADFVAKATSATGRRNKKNAEAWDAVYDACCENSENPRPNYYAFSREWKASNI